MTQLATLPVVTQEFLGLTYKVEQLPNHADPQALSAYRLTGERGARYVLRRSRTYSAHLVAMIEGRVAIAPPFKGRVFVTDPTLRLL